MCETLSEYMSTTMTSLLTQLKSDPDTESVLLRNQDLIANYPNIAGLYYQWGFSPNRRIFTASLERDEVMAALSNELQIKDSFDDLDLRKDEEWDVHRPMKWEVERTYRTESLAQLADLHEMGMGNNLEMLNDFPAFPDDLEDPELTTMWCQDPYNTPRTTHQSRGDFTTPRSSRGLKKLSVKVKELVSDKCITTYKEVADELIRSLEDEDEKRREEKNIRRRVYDALNVLSAAGVITKKGKQVTWVGRCSGSPFSSGSSEELRERIEQKTLVLKELAGKNQTLKALIERNQKRPQRDRLGFPLLVIATKQSQKNQVQLRQVILSSTCSGTELHVKLETRFKLMGDMDVLKHFKMLKMQPLQQELSKLIS